MNPFKTLDQESLLDALTEFYHKYRRIIELGHDQQEFDSTKSMLECILSELNERKTQQESEGPERPDFEFNRIDRRAD